MNLDTLARIMHISRRRYADALREGALERPKGDLTPTYIEYVQQVMGTWGKQPAARKKAIRKLMKDCEENTGEGRGAFYVRKLEELAK